MKKFFWLRLLTASCFLVLFAAVNNSCTSREKNSDQNELAVSWNGSGISGVNTNKRDTIKEKVFESFNIGEQPYFPGGEEALIGFIQKNMLYPKDAKENGVEGTVFVRFEVTKNGEIGETQITRTVDASLEYEALRIVKALPKWRPGKKDGKPVNVWLIVPVEFRLH